MRLSTSSWTVQVDIDALEPGPSATTAVPSTTVDCEWAFKIKPDEAALVSCPVAVVLPLPAPAGHHDDTHARSRARITWQGSQPEAARLATGGELGLSGSSGLARTLDARLGSATGTESPRPAAPWPARSGMMAVSQLRSGCTGSWYPPQPASEARVMACSCPECASA